jgi:hypothetical protein
MATILMYQNQEYQIPDLNEIFLKVIVAQALQLDSGAILAVGRNLRSLILVFLIGQQLVNRISLP